MITYYAFVLLLFITRQHKLLAKTQPLSINSNLTYLELNYQYATTKGIQIYSNFIAVFLLSSLNMAVELGESFSNTAGSDDYFARVRASQLTWAHNLKHLYSVVGSGETEHRLLANSSICLNLTSKFYPVMNGDEQVFSCKGIKVLFLPYCDAGSWVQL